jgi:hypothetical protein
LAADPENRQVLRQLTQLAATTRHSQWFLCRPRTQLKRRRLRVVRTPRATASPSTGRA